MLFQEMFSACDQNIYRHQPEKRAASVGELLTSPVKRTRFASCKSGRRFLNVQIPPHHHEKTDRGYCAARRSCVRGAASDVGPNRHQRSIADRSDGRVTPAGRSGNHRPETVRAAAADRPHCRYARLWPSTRASATDSERRPGMGGNSRPAARRLGHGTDCPRETPCADAIRAAAMLNSAEEVA